MTTSSPARRRQDLGPRPCPVCRRAAAPEELEGPLPAPDLAALVAVNSPGWDERQGLCLRCRVRFSEALQLLRQHKGSLGVRPILPTPLRLGAPDRFRGRGVTIAFLDSGFFAHPDLVEPRDRIVAYADVTGSRKRRRDLERPDESSWHGMMTSVVACGNGRLSEGFYRALASEARLVLVKVGTARRIVHDDIRRGLEWVVRHRRRYGIGIVNVSCGGDYEASYLHDGLSRAAETATRDGILVCAAVGNRGHLPEHPVLPPASAPSVLAVGGLDDNNRLAFAGYAAYPSSYGPTMDGLQKPEVLAPAIWVAAPILPGTPTAAQAGVLARLAQAPDVELTPLLGAHRGLDPELDAAAGREPMAVRALVRRKLDENHVISAFYKHVDGTSFASPIVASVAALMLEANPSLAPAELKRLLIRTARRLPDLEVDKQGWGVVDAAAAVEAALAFPRRRRDPKQARD